MFTRILQCVKLFVVAQFLFWSRMVLVWCSALKEPALSTAERLDLRLNSRKSFSPARCLFVTNQDDFCLFIFNDYLLLIDLTVTPPTRGRSLCESQWCQQEGIKQVAEVLHWKWKYLHFSVCRLPMMHALCFKRLISPMIPSGLASMSEGFSDILWRFYTNCLFTLNMSEWRSAVCFNKTFLHVSQTSQISSDKHINHKYKQNKTWKEQFTQKNSQKAQVVRDAEIRLCANISLTDTVKISAKKQCISGLQ